MTILEALKSVSNYPVPQRTFSRIAVVRGLNLTQDATQTVLASREFRFAEADVLMWLTKAPSIAEGGVSIGITPKESERFRAEANEIYSELGTKERIYGYKGDTL